MSKKASNGWPQLTSNTIKDHIALAVFKTEKKHGGAFSSAHELYSVLLEEIEEFQDSFEEGDPDPAELMDVLSAAYLGVRWLSKVNGEDISSSLLAKKSDTEPLAIEDVQGLCASMLRDLKTFWASVKKNEPSCQALVKLIDTTSGGLLWLCQEGRNEIQDTDLSTPPSLPLGQSLQRENQKSFLSDIEFWLTSFGWVLMAGEELAVRGWVVPEHFRTNTWFALQGRGLTFKLQDAVALQVSYAAWVLTEPERRG